MVPISGLFYAFNYYCAKDDNESAAYRKERSRHVRTFDLRDRVLPCAIQGCPLRDIVYPLEELAFRPEGNVVLQAPSD